MRKKLSIICPVVIWKNGLFFYFIYYFFIGPNFIDALSSDSYFYLVALCHCVAAVHYRFSLIYFSLPNSANPLFHRSCSGVGETKV